MTTFKRLKLGMVGGGQGAFIGAVHRIASRIDDRWELVAGGAVIRRRARRRIRRRPWHRARPQLRQLCPYGPRRSCAP